MGVPAQSMNQETTLINWAKTQLPDPSNYGTTYCAPHNFAQGKRVMFKRVLNSHGWRWQFVEVLDIRKEDYRKKNTQGMY